MFGNRTLNKFSYMKIECRIKVPEGVSRDNVQKFQCPLKELAETMTGSSNVIEDVAGDRKIYFACKSLMLIYV